MEHLCETKVCFVALTPCLDSQKFRGVCERDFPSFMSCHQESELVREDIFEISRKCSKITDRRVFEIFIFFLK